MLNYRKHSTIIHTLGFLFLSFGSLLFLVQSSYYEQHGSTLSTAITFDFLITIPIIYFLCIRRSTVPKFTVLSVFVLCLIAASIILPSSEQKLLTQAKFYIIPIIEIGVLSLIFIKTNQTVRAFKKNLSNNTDFFTALSNACRDILPNPINGAIATEIAVMYYLFGGGTTKYTTEYSFSYHKKNGISIVIGLFVIIILIETVAMHLFVGQWNHAAAWVLTGLSTYTCLQVIALARSLPKRPVVIDVKSKSIALRYGFFNEATIQLDAIKSIEFSRKTLPDDKSIVPFSPLHTFDTHNIIMHFYNPQIMRRMYGLTKTFSSLAIGIDEKEQFMEIIKKLKNNDVT